MEFRTSWEPGEHHQLSSSSVFVLVEVKLRECITSHINVDHLTAFNKPQCSAYTTSLEFQAGPSLQQLSWGLSAFVFESLYKSSGRVRTNEVVETISRIELRRGYFWVEVVILIIHIHWVGAGGSSVHTCTPFPQTSLHPTRHPLFLLVQSHLSLRFGAKEVVI